MLGGTVPMEQLLARSDQAAIALRGITAYADGMELTIVAARRHQPRSDEFLHHMPFDRDIHIGLQYADGRQLRSVGWNSRGSGEGGIWPDGGGGGGQQYEQRLWVWPLPPPGELAVVVEWTDFGIRETWRWLDATPIVEAAARAAAVWPDDLEAGAPAGRHRPNFLSSSTLGVNEQRDETSDDAGQSAP